MPNCQKLYDRIRSAPNNSRIEDVCALAECAGFVFKRQTSSHRIYKKPGEMVPMNFQVDKATGKAKWYQVRQLLEFIEDKNVTFTEDGQS